ncbi:MAG: TetR/AcrR family transcriptional regulator [Rhodospirillales bacterium]
MDDAEPQEAQMLAPRSVPRQRRAIERRRAILDAALSLLEENSLDSLTTSLIALRAGVPVASVYAYFPNKMAVVAELAREAMEEVDTLLTALLPATIDAAGIDVAVDRSIEAVLGGYRAVPARQRLFSSIRGNATLEPVLRESDDRMVRVLARNIATARPDLPPLRARAIAQTTVATFTAMQDYVLPCEDAEYLEVLVGEWRRIVKGYLLVLTQ